jgi:hypothetical protein
MKRRLLALALGACLSAPTMPMSQPAEPRGLDAAFGNTVRGVHSNCLVRRYWLESNRTWRGTGRTGTPSHGGWTQTGDQVCLRNQNNNVACLTVPNDARVGSKWRGEATGQWGIFSGSTTLDFEVVRGHEPYSPTPRCSPRRRPSA